MKLNRLEKTILLMVALLALATCVHAEDPVQRTPQKKTIFKALSFVEDKLNDVAKAAAKTAKDYIEFRTEQEKAKEAAKPSPTPEAPKVKESDFVDY